MNNLVIAAIVALVVLIVYLFVNTQSSDGTNTQSSDGTNAQSSEGFSLATDYVLSRYGYQTPPVHGYRVRARAYHSCDTPADCVDKLNKIPHVNKSIVNPFVWPYSATTTPDRIHEALHQQTDHVVLV